MEKRTFWQTFLGTLQGMDNEGSAKRATAFFAVAFLLTSLLAVYEWSLVQAVLSTTPTQIHLTTWTLKYSGPSFYWSLPFWDLQHLN